MLRFVGRAAGRENPSSRRELLFGGVIHNALLLFLGVEVRMRPFSRASQRFSLSGRCLSAGEALIELERENLPGRSLASISKPATWDCAAPSRVLVLVKRPILIYSSFCTLDLIVSQNWSAHVSLSDLEQDSASHWISQIHHWTTSTSFPDCYSTTALFACLSMHLSFLNFNTKKDRRSSGGGTRLSETTEK